MGQLAFCEINYYLLLLFKTSLVTKNSHKITLCQPVKQSLICCVSLIKLHNDFTFVLKSFKGSEFLNILDKFEFHPNPATDYIVSCL